MELPSLWAAMLATNGRPGGARCGQRPMWPCGPVVLPFPWPWAWPCETDKPFISCRAPIRRQMSSMYHATGGRVEHSIVLILQVPCATEVKSCHVLFAICHMKGRRGFHGCFRHAHFRIQWSQARGTGLPKWAVADEFLGSRVACLRVCGLLGADGRAAGR